MGRHARNGLADARVKEVRDGIALWRRTREKRTTMPAERAEFLTTELAVRWAVRSAGVQHATHARRLAIVRAFAVWLQATDAEKPDEHLERNAT